MWASRGESTLEAAGGAGGYLKGPVGAADRSLLLGQVCQRRVQATAHCGEREVGLVSELVSEQAHSGKGSWFADIRLMERGGSRWIGAEIKLRMPAVRMVQSVGAAVSDPGDTHDSARRLAVARALRDLARLVVDSA
jgi:hypothetical protein